MFRKIWKSFELVAARCLSKSGYVAIEWPTGCSYWNGPDVKKFMEIHGLDYVSIHGCALGLTSVVNGIPIKKPWAIVTNYNEIISALEGKRCLGEHLHPEHQPCAWSDTKRTECYTDLMVGMVRVAFASSLRRCDTDYGPVPACCSLVAS